MCDFLRVDEFAATLNLKAATVRAWILRRKITVIRLGGHAVRIPRSEVDRLISEGTTLAVSRDGRGGAKQ